MAYQDHSKLVVGLRGPAFPLSVLCLAGLCTDEPYRLSSVVSCV